MMSCPFTRIRSELHYCNSARAGSETVTLAPHEARGRRASLQGRDSTTHPRALVRIFAAEPVETHVDARRPLMEATSFTGTGDLAEPLRVRGAKILVRMRSIVSSFM